MFSNIQLKDRLAGKVRMQDFVAAHIDSGTIWVRVGGEGQAKFVRLRWPLDLSVLPVENILGSSVCRLGDGGAWLQNAGVPGTTR